MSLSCEKFGRELADHRRVLRHNSFGENTYGVEKLHLGSSGAIHARSPHPPDPRVNMAAWRADRLGREKDR